MALLNGCGRSIADPPGTVRVTIWSGWTGQEEKSFLRVLARYHELHPHIIIENLGAVSDDNKTVRAIVAGVPPDVFAIWNLFYLGPLAANGAVYPLDDQFRQSGLREEDFVPAALSECRYQGHLYAMPYLIDCTALLWNKRAFRQAGLDPDRPPRTLKEIEEYAVKLTRRDPATGKLIQLGLQPLTDPYILTPLFGGRLYDPKTNRVTPDDPANVAGLQWYNNLIDRMGGYKEVNAFAAGFGQSQGTNNPFFVNKVAMMFNGEWNPYWCYRYAPQMEYGVAPLPPPLNRPGGAPANWLGGNIFCIPKGSKHPKEAWDLLVWLQSDEAQALFASQINNVPNRRSTLKSPQLRTGLDYKRKFSIFLDLADSPNSGYFPVLPVANLYGTELITARDLVLNGQKTPAQALDDVRVRVQRELDRYR